MNRDRYGRFMKPANGPINEEVEEWYGENISSALDTLTTDLRRCRNGLAHLIERRLELLMPQIDAMRAQIDSMNTEKWRLNCALRYLELP